MNAKSPILVVQVKHISKHVMDQMDIVLIPWFGIASILRMQCGQTANPFFLLLNQTPPPNTKTLG